MTAFKFIIRFDVGQRKKEEKFNANEFHLLRDLHFKSAYFLRIDPACLRHIVNY